MRYLKYLILILFIPAAFISCEEEEFEFGDITAPSNLSVTAEIVGVDADHPNGDGSGEVVFTAIADNAITYKYIVGAREILAPSGEAKIFFSDTGLSVYDVVVIASGSGGSSSSTAVQVEVLVEYTPPADLLEMLVGSGSRTWRMQAEETGHFGVGPADGFEPIWYAAGPNDKAGLGMYDDRITFHADGTVDYNTNGDIMGKAYAIDPIWGDKGQVVQENDEYWNYPLDPFAGTWFISAPEGQETLNFTDNVFGGFFVGGSSYMILDRTANTMSLRVIGDDGLAWYMVLVAE